MLALPVGAALFGAGCLPLMIPGLAYQGYKYEHNKNQPTATASSTQSKNSTASTSSAQSNKATTPPPKKISDSDIE
jgi:hypothetical protein